MYYLQYIALIILVGIFSTFGSAHAGWKDKLGDLLGNKDEQSQPSTTQQTVDALTQEDMSRAVLDALSVGVQRAIELLGKNGGYLNDAQVRIPMPDNLTQAESLLRKFRQDKYADQFIGSMNQSAERAAPKTTRIFLEAIKNMSLSDAQTIVQGPEDAATQFFKRQVSEKLHAVIKPVVSKTMDEVGVTATYKKFISKADFLKAYMDTDAFNIDDYVAGKTLDGLFLKLAEEEKRIRKDPVARSTDILKKVFGQYSL